VHFRTVATSEVAHRAGVRPMSPRWPQAFRPVWRALKEWSARTPVGYGLAGSSGRQPEPGVGVRGRSTAAGPGGGAALVGASVAPPPILPPPEPAPAVTTDSRKRSERAADAGHCARLSALIATLPSPDREILLLRVGAGVSIPDIVATLGVTPAAIRRAQHQALSAPQLAATAHDPPPATRQRVVLLPHARTQPTDTRSTNRRTGRVPGMNHDDSPRHHPTQSDGTTPASTQWHDVELALKVARHSFDSWLVAGHEDTPSLAIMHASHTHTALHEAARAITMLIETFRVEVTALITTPAHGTDTLTQRR
jgi:Sigma-70, region 4